MTVNSTNLTLKEYLMVILKRCANRVRNSHFKYRWRH